MKTKLIQLRMTDHGIDGMDATTTTVACFSSVQKAKAWLTVNQYTHQQYGEYYHHDEKMRHRMGAISYKIEEDLLPLDPEPSRDLLDEAITARIRKEALGKLNSQERKVLGL